MRRLWMLVFVVVAAVGGCSLMEEDPPGRKCRGNPDCFRAQGETCDVAQGICVPMIDAGARD